MHFYVKTKKLQINCLILKIETILSKLLELIKYYDIYFTLSNLKLQT